MTQERGPIGPQFSADRRPEQEAVRTTIVGGRPPGSGQSVGEIPRGIEVLVKKASVDPAFRELLLTRRAEAAEEIGLQLEPAEAMMLAAAPREQLEMVISRTIVPAEHRRVFLGKVAAAMLAVLGVAVVGALVSSAGVRSEISKGERPDRPQSAGERVDRPPAEGKPSNKVVPDQPQAESKPNEEK